MNPGKDECGRDRYTFIPDYNWATHDWDKLHPYSLDPNRPTNLTATKPIEEYGNIFHCKGIRKHMLEEQTFEDFWQGKKVRFNTGSSVFRGKIDLCWGQVVREVEIKQCWTPKQIEANKVKIAKEAKEREERDLIRQRM